MVSFLAPEREYVVPVVPLWAYDLAHWCQNGWSQRHVWHQNQALVSKNGTMVPTCLQDDMDVPFGTRSGIKHIGGLVVPIASGLGIVALNDRRARSRTGPMTLRPVCQSLVMDTESNQKDIAAKKHRSCTFSACCSYAAEWQRSWVDFWRQKVGCCWCQKFSPHYPFSCPIFFYLIIHFLST